jgi:uncharacterized protein (DUF488 family)
MNKLTYRHRFALSMRYNSSMKTIYTIGHSTHPIETFLALLQAHSIEVLVDVRTVPRSRHNPQFETNALRTSLSEAGIRYVHMAALGGLRRPRKDSPNTGWHNESFRGFADYMHTAEFQAAFDELQALAQPHVTAIMCAEALPLRCHRSLIADALIVHGWQVLDIMSDKAAIVHKLTPFLKVEDGRILYPPMQMEFKVQ